MLTKALSLLLITLLGFTLGLEAARFAHVYSAGSGVGAAVMTGTGGTSGTSMVNIHRTLLGFSLLATSGALLLSFRGRGGLGVGAWLSRQWLRFTTRLELTLDGLFDLGFGASLSESARGSHLMTLYKIAPRPPNDDLHPCRGCSWCGVDPGDLPDALRTECDGSGRYLPSNEAERKRKLAQPKLPLQATPCPPPSREGKQPDGNYVIEVGPDETAEDVVRRHPDVLRIHQGTGDILVKNRGTGGVIVRPKEPAR